MRLHEQGQIAIISLYALENNGVRHVATPLREAGFSVTEIYFKDWVNNRFHGQKKKCRRSSSCSRTGHRLRGLLGARERFPSDGEVPHGACRHAAGLPSSGGMHPLPERCISIADYISVGEVGKAVVHFFDAIERGESARDVPGFWARDGETIFRNDIAGWSTSTDSVPRSTLRRTIPHQGATVGTPHHEPDTRSGTDPILDLSFCSTRLKPSRARASSAFGR